MTLPGTESQAQLSERGLSPSAVHADGYALRNMSVLAAQTAMFANVVAGAPRGLGAPKRCLVSSGCCALVHPSSPVFMGVSEPPVRVPNLKYIAMTMATNGECK